MPTKSEAAEALHRAAKNAALGVSGWDWCFTPAVRDQFQALCRAIVDYESAPPDSTPDPLPAEVQRVLEAAGKLAPVLDEALRDAYTDDYLHRHICDCDVRALEGVTPDFLAAVTAYRATQQQPEPLSARLARLGKGAAVQAANGVWSVVANDPEAEQLWLRGGDAVIQTGVFQYREIARILSESP